VKKEKINACSGCKRLFSFLQKSLPNKEFFLRLMKNCQHQQKGKPDTQKKIEDAATSVEDAYMYNVYRSQLIWHAL
jgi:hypothetical protein